jgi:hypothetical protein
MQGFLALPAKMHSMFSLQAFFSNQSALALRWLVAVWIGLALMGSASAQFTPQKIDLQEETQRVGVQVRQTLWIDESLQLDFERARTQEFKPFNPFERLNLGNKVTWLRLQIEHTDATTGPLLLHLLPPHIGEVALYSPSSNAPEVWTKRQVDNKELTSKIKVGEASKGDIFYLRISSRNNASILAFLGGKEEMNVHDSKLAVVMTFISTLTLITFIIFLWRTLRLFSWMSVLSCALLLSYQIQFWIGMGYAYSILNLPLAAGILMVTPNIIANITIAGGILVLIGCTLFPNQKWLRWVWVWSALQFCMFIYAFIEPAAASRLSMTIWLIGPLCWLFF